MKYTISEKDKIQKDNEQKEIELNKRIREEFIKANTYSEFRIITATKYGYNPFFLFDGYWWYNFSMEHPNILMWIDRLTSIFIGIFSVLISDSVFHNWIFSIIPILLGILIKLKISDWWIDFSVGLKYDQKYYDENGKMIGEL